MQRALAVVRTVFLIFIAGYGFRAMPWYTSVPKTLDEQYARCSSAVDMLIRAVWFAVAWILVDTLLSWWIATRSRKAAASTAAPPGPARA